MGLTVDTDVPELIADDLFGKSVDDLQEDITVGSTGIDGTLKYIDDYTAAGYRDDEASGHYLVLHVDVPDVTGVTYTVEVLGGVHGPQTLDSDQTAICFIRKTTNRIKITASKSGYTVTRIYRLNGLKLA